MKVDKQLRRVERDSSQIRERIHQLNLPLHGGNTPGASRRGRPDDGTQDLFAWGSRQKKFKQAGSISLRRGASHTSVPARHGRGRGGRLGQYLYCGRTIMCTETGSFLSCWWYLWWRTWSTTSRLIRV